MTSADIRFYFDPVCPFCWLTSKWIRMVQAERDLTVDWRFISLRLINYHIDYSEPCVKPRNREMACAGLTS